MILTGQNRNSRGKTCPNATLSTINPTWTCLESNLDLRGERPDKKLSSSSSLQGLSTNY
jgi:hypothetical protein